MKYYVEFQKENYRGVVSSVIRTTYKDNLLDAIYDIIKSEITKPGYKINLAEYKPAHIFTENIEDLHMILKEYPSIVSDAINDYINETMGV